MKYVLKERWEGLKLPRLFNMAINELKSLEGVPESEYTDLANMAPDDVPCTLRGLIETGSIAIYNANWIALEIERLISRIIVMSIVYAEIGELSLLNAELANNGVHKQDLGSASIDKLKLISGALEGRIFNITEGE